MSISLLCVAILGVAFTLHGCGTGGSGTTTTTTTSALARDCGSSTPSELPCLCVFDIDRTLTGRQGDVTVCQRNKLIQGVYDNAFGGGVLTLSSLAAVGINTTFCARCYLGLCSAGDADGDKSKERSFLLDRVLRTTLQDNLRARLPSASAWSWYTSVQSPLVLGAPNTQKQISVEHIRQWYNDRGICIPSQNVFFFDDRVDNVPPFAAFGFNAREISCGSRDQGIRMVGYCGARPEEIVNESGVASCVSQTCDTNIIPKCLCVFDIDRTLTGRQGDISTCPLNEVMLGVHDNGYGSGNLTLSALAAIGINTTFCGECYLGVCSAGDADGEGSLERAILLERVLRTKPFDELRAAVPSASIWSTAETVKSPLVLGSANLLKQYSVEAIRRWYNDQGICIPSQNVYFFDDRLENIPPFNEMAFNSRVVSCNSRDNWLYNGSGMVGYCGATPDEIRRESGAVGC